MSHDATPSNTIPSPAPRARADHHWLQRYPSDVNWFQTFDPEPLTALLDRAIARFPHTTCTSFLGSKLSYGEIGSRVIRAAAHLQSLGVVKGTRVGLLLPNTPTFIIYYFAALKCGAIVVNYNPLYTVEELAEQVRDSGTDLMITLDLKILFDKVEALLQQGVLPRALVASFAALLPSAKALLFKLLKSAELAAPNRSPLRARITLESETAMASTPFSPVAIDPERDVAVLQYTGGTTGLPKGAMLTHANLSINTQQVVSWATDLAEGEDRVLAVLPFFHVFAMTVVMNFGIARCAEIVLMPRFVLNDALALIHQSRPTVMPGVPTLFNAILNHPRLEAFDLSSLKFCVSGGAALPVEVKRGFEAATGCRVLEGYGLTETSPVALCNPLNAEQKDGSIGLPLPQTRVSLRSLDDPSVEVAIGEKGEICLAGPQVMIGYWNRPDETRDAFVDGLLRTGDVAIQDADGYTFIVDRIKDLIICSGFNVYPRRIEDALYAHDAVAEVTVVGIPDAYRGEVPKAFVKLKPGRTGVTAKDLYEHLAPKLSKIEMPAEIEFRDELPKTLIGKLSKKELRAEARPTEQAESTGPERT